MTQWITVEPNDHLSDLLQRLETAGEDEIRLVIPSNSGLLLTASEFRALASRIERSNLDLQVETSDPLRIQLATMMGVPVATLAVDETADDETIDPDQDLAAETTDRSPAGRHLWTRRLLIAAIASVVALGVGYLLGRRFWLSSEVKLTLATQPITSEITVSVVQAGEAVPAGTIGVETEPVSFDFSMSLTADVTGTETVGDLAAQGELVLRNGTNSAIDLPAGSEIPSFDGGTYTTAADITVPPMSGDTPGEAMVAVVAATPGAAENEELGMLTGQLDNGLYFSNRNEPIAGGTDTEIRVVSQDDLDRLRQQATEAMTERATSATTSDGGVVVPSSVQGGEGQFEYSHQVGDPADSVSVDASMQFTGTVFSSDQLAQQADASLAAAVPAGWTLASTVPAYQPTMNSDGTMTITITGEAQPTVDREWLESIAQNLAGRSETAARDYLSSVPEIDSYTLEIAPDWFPGGMPSDAGQIDVTTS